MGGLIELGSAILSRASQKSEIFAQNIVNATTIGYKRRIAFDSLLTVDSPDLRSVGTDVDFSSGKTVHTGNSYDLSISGNGFFVVGSGDRIFYTRNGQFRLDGDGNLVTSDGLRLQIEGRNIDFSADRIAIDPDGTIRHGDEVVGKIALMDFDRPSALDAMGNGRFRATGEVPREVNSPRILQGSLEASNTSSAGEMIALMTAVRSAETGQRVVQLYDDMMAEAAAGFGQG
jgi:flagellar basal body rod protein FlgG